MALSTLTEKKAAQTAEGDYPESRTFLASYSLTFAPFLIVHRWPEGLRSRRKEMQRWQNSDLPFGIYSKGTRTSMISYRR